MNVYRDLAASLAYVSYMVKAKTERKFGANASVAWNSRTRETDPQRGNDSQCLQEEGLP